eukprot:6173145-Pleurochrysis_carterae.AAC.1
MSKREEQDEEKKMNMFDALVSRLGCTAQREPGLVALRARDGARPRTVGCRIPEFGRLVVVDCELRLALTPREAGRDDGAGILVGTRGEAAEGGRPAEVVAVATTAA